MPSLELRGIHRSYGDIQVLKGVDLELREGETYGLLGPNGAGKTTLFRCMLGLLTPDSGRVLIDGEEFDFSREKRSQLGYLPSGVSFYGNLTAEENMRFFADLVDSPPDTDELLDQVGLAEDQDRKVKEFSTGMKKRLGIAQSLLRQPDIMVYDEPTTGLDPEGKKRFRRQIRRVTEDEEVTVLVSSHITGEIEPVCDRFGILADGEIQVSGTKQEISREERTRIQLSSEPSEPVGAEVEDGYVVVDPGETEDVLRRLIDAGAGIESVEPARETLEDVYMRVAEG
nr:MAG: ABC-type multidrug transport system, ATPase component [Candidatus Nanosalinarum sp. J07AB56]